MLKHPQKLKILVIYTHLSFILYTLFFVNYYWLLLGTLSGIIINIIGNNVGLHRYFSHKSFETKFDLFLKFFSTISCLGSQINYCMVHRHHHQFSDTKNDPQNPKKIGLLKSIIMDYDKVKINPKIVSDLIKDPHLKFIHQNYFLIIFIYSTTLFLININLFIYCFCLPAIMCWWSAVTIGTITHLYGYRNFINNDNSYNNILASIISMGEGWHNNHHNNSSNYKHGIEWWEFDPAARFIEQIKI